MPYASEYGVALVEVRTEVLYAQSAYGSLSCQSLWVSAIFFIIFTMFLLADSTAPFIYG